jgi:hypothetical protein
LGKYDPRHPELAANRTFQAVGPGADRLNTQRDAKPQAKGKLVAMRFVLSLAVLLLFGCRTAVPVIPPSIQPSEYQMYRAWIEQYVSSHPNHLPIEVRDFTSNLEWHRRFENRCLPNRMQNVFDVTFNHEWNIREAALNAWDSNSGQNIATFTSSHDHSLCPMEFLTFSRVAFDPTSSEAYLWVEDITCSRKHTSDCDGGTGALYRATRQKDQSWKFAVTSCLSHIFD